MPRIPTVKFDASRVTDAVKIDLKQAIASLGDIRASDVDFIYAAAIRSVSAGRDLRTLYTTLMTLDHMTERRASHIALFLNNRASSMMDRARMLQVGIKYAKWTYSGAPCEPVEIDRVHREANGNRFAVSRGMFIDGKWTWPGVESGCKCVMTAIVPGFS